MLHLNQFLEGLKTTLPSICVDRDLVAHVSDIFKSLSTIHRMRSRGQVPSHFFIDPNFYYLRDDVIDWLHSRYQEGKTPILQKTPPASIDKQATIQKKKGRLCSKK